MDVMETAKKPRVRRPGSRPFIGGTVAPETAEALRKRHEAEGGPLARVLDALLRVGLGLPMPDQTVAELVQVTGARIEHVAGSVNALNGTGAIRRTSVSKPFTWAIDPAHVLPARASAPRASKPLSGAGFPTRAEALAMVARGDYDAPPGVRFELEAWTLVSTTEIDAAHLDRVTA